MQIVPTSITVVQYCKDLTSGEIQVERKYQRSDRVWPIQAQSFLIETILLGFPMPKLFLHQVTDRISKKTVRYIVDGQQRSTAIKAFFNDELRLSKTLDFEEATGRTYSELSEEYQYKFLSYGLGVELLVNTNEDEVREMFRRINSYEVPLNPEEQRHARWQGEFKWYIYNLSKRFDETLIRIGAFSEKQIVRMQDMKILAEISHALINGITTTNKRSLNNLYRDHDESFPQTDLFSENIERAIQFVNQLESVYGTALMKPYSLYSLLIAIIHVNDEVDALAELTPGGQGLASERECNRRLSVLAAEVEEGNDDGEYGDFIRANEKATNTKAHRLTRFQYYIDAVSRTSDRRFE